MNKAFVVAVPQEVDNLKKIKNIPIFYTGIGKLNAILTTSKLICNGYDEIINIGSCGSKKISSGTLIKVGKSYEDIDVSPIFKYGISNVNDLEHIDIDINSKYSCFSTDYFFDNTQVSKYSQDYLSMIERCDIFDMECFSHAKICKLYNIKFSSYKWVSDDGSHNSWIENCKIGFNSFLKEFDYFL